MSSNIMSRSARIEQDQAYYSNSHSREKESAKIAQNNSHEKKTSPSPDTQSKFVKSYRMVPVKK